IPDIALRRNKGLEGTVTAGGRPVANAVIDVRWDIWQKVDARSVRADANGRFQLADVPPGRPVVVRVRSGDKVNAKLAFSAREVEGALALEVSADHAFSVRGRVVDPEGNPVRQAKVVISGDAVLPEALATVVVLPDGEVDEPDEEKVKKPGRPM